MKKLYIKTFGCQMNEYDSDKMADVLRVASRADGDTMELHRVVPEDADVILYNTCSVREKAQEKVFSDLGRAQATVKTGPKPELVIGVGGCVASQEGEAIVEARAVCRRGFRAADAAPVAAAHRSTTARQGKSQVDIRFPEIEKFDYLPPAKVERRDRLRVDHGRLLEILQLLRRPVHARRRSITPIRGCAGNGNCRTRRARRERSHAAWTKRQRVSRLRYPMEMVAKSTISADDHADFALLLEYVCRDPRHRAGPFHDLAPQGIQRSDSLTHTRRHAQGGLAPASTGAIRIGPHFDGDEAGLHDARIQIDRAPAAGHSTGSVPCRRTSSSAFRVKRTRTSKPR